MAVSGSDIGEGLPPSSYIWLEIYCRETKGANPPVLALQGNISARGRNLFATSLRELGYAPQRPPAISLHLAFPGERVP